MPSKDGHHGTKSAVTVSGSHQEYLNPINILGIPNTTAAGGRRPNPEGARPTSSQDAAAAAPASRMNFKLVSKSPGSRCGMAGSLLNLARIPSKSSVQRSNSARWVVIGWHFDTGHSISYSSLIGPQGGLPVRGHPASQQQEAGDSGAGRGQGPGRLPDPVPGGQRGARSRPRGGLQTPARVPQCTRGRHSAQPLVTPHFPVVQCRRHQHTQEAGQEERKKRHPETQIFLRSST